MSCKVCYREYKDRPNDMCKSYLHWQAYANHLEANSSGKKVKQPPKFNKGERVQIADYEHSSRDYGRFLGFAATIEEVLPHARNKPQEYIVMPDNSTRATLRIYEGDLENKD